MNHRRWTIGLASLTAAAMSCQGVRAQSSEYVVMAGDQATFHVLKGGVLLRSWGLADGTKKYQYPVAVMDTVRTMGANQGDVGAEYDLDGNDLGARYTHPAPSGRCWDGTTDGEFNYAIDTAGGVYRFDRDWSNSQSLFNTSGFGGITYDPSNNSLWISQWSGTTVSNYNMDGELLGSFDTGHRQNMALALDHADDTLWLHDRNVQGTFEQWTKSGERLARIAIPGMSTQNALGGEFAFGGGGCGDKAKLKAICKGGGAKVVGKLKKATANTPVTFKLDDGQERKAQTNKKGKAKGKWKKQEAGPHSVTVCKLHKDC